MWYKLGELDDVSFMLLVSKGLYKTLKMAFFVECWAVGCKFFKILAV